MNCCCSCAWCPSDPDFILLLLLFSSFTSRSRFGVIGMLCVRLLSTSTGRPRRRYWPSPLNSTARFFLSSPPAFTWSSLTKYRSTHAHVPTPRHLLAIALPQAPAIHFASPSPQPYLFPFLLPSPCRLTKVVAPPSVEGAADAVSGAAEGAEDDDGGGKRLVVYILIGLGAVFVSYMISGEYHTL